MASGTTVAPGEDGMAKGQRTVAKLTKRTVDGLRPSDQHFTVWDAELPGFGCRIYPTRHRVFIFK